MKISKLTRAKKKMSIITLASISLLPKGTYALTYSEYNNFVSSIVPIVVLSIIAIALLSYFSKH